jgi:hypothetical protein
MPEVGRDTAESPFEVAMAAIYICRWVDLQGLPKQKRRGQGVVADRRLSVCLVRGESQ